MAAVRPLAMPAVTGASTVSSSAAASRTGRMLIAGPRDLQAALDEYAAHGNRHRPPRSRNLRPPDRGDSITAPVTALATARIRRHEVLGGLIHEYGPAA